MGGRREKPPPYRNEDSWQKHFLDADCRLTMLMQLSADCSGHRYLVLPRHDSQLVREKSRSLRKLVRQLPLQLAAISADVIT